MGVVGAGVGAGRAAPVDVGVGAEGAAFGLGTETPQVKRDDGLAAVGHRLVHRGGHTGQGVVGDGVGRDRPGYGHGTAGRARQRDGGDQPGGQGQCGGGQGAPGPAGEY